MSEQDKYKRRPVFHWAALLLFILIGAGFGTWQVMVHPDTPLSPEWNPVQPLVVSDPVTSLTRWKLRRALGDDAVCLAALATGAQAVVKPDFTESEQCFIAPQVTLSGVAGALVAPVNTRCQTALRLAMWTQHDLQPAARELFDQSLKQIEHFSSYSCRPIRTPLGGSGRISTHSTANSIDISGFVLADGTRLILLSDWEGAEVKSSFLRRANITACKWFRVTLGPEYNNLHADHFHLQHTGFGLCR
ncbi:extensin-like domain-containing protein [Sulfitobacter guttiformis]|uniref:Extensin-like C-terminal domain-containing protein n=1 Tax=Sulfitobacter guttiformis TaxID=74349 RepID=A0A420DSD9_9RHOB|nr:extensin family protein [Sulfitobacter guttiformis]KIN74460.1 Extensin-like protein [Sulfitobacter guttiformis KCTC 32187]RKE97057.1 hypothetical protein C8N30_1639 [Sulfitobacter guttiformis]